MPVAGGLDARFVEAGGALAQAYDIIEKLVAALEGVTKALDREAADAAVANLRGTAGRLARLPEIQAQRAEALDEIRKAGASLNTDIGQVNRTLSFLRICGLNMMVTSAGVTEFSSFVDTMFQKLDVGEAQIGNIALEIGRMVTGLPDTSAIDAQLAAECAKVIPHVPQQLAADAQALQKHQAEVAVRADKVARVARDVRTKVGTAIGALQIGDITRQRLEHIADGLRNVLELVDDDPAALAASPAGAHVVAMLAAQATDTLTTFRAEAQTLVQSLRSIGASTAELLALREGDGGEDDSGFLASLEASVAEIETVTARLREADARSHKLSSAASATAEQLADRLRTVHRITGDVQQMAWNTDLRSYRLGVEGRGLAVVAAETRTFSVKLADISNSISASFERMMLAASKIRDPDGAEGQADESLATSLAVIRDAGERMRTGMAGLGGDATRIVDILRDTTERVDCEAEVSAALADVVGDLSGLGTEAAAIDDDTAAQLTAMLDAIARTYTMAREREIHRQFVPGAEEAPPETGAIDEDDDDDGLF
ncbi:MAG: hypothetical protein J7483_06570 [Novosphingobium sp.]|nr:hypothetical protein [Novosphingobium sp.]